MSISSPLRGSESSLLRTIVLLLCGTIGQSSVVGGPGAKGGCLSNLVVQRTSDTTAQLVWEFSCDPADLQLYKVHYSHVRYISCPDGRKDTSRPSGFGTVETTSHSVKLIDLHPHSEYSVEVRAIMRPSRPGRPDSLKTELRTEYGLPRVRPAESRLDYTYRWTANQLVFGWSPPLAASLCGDFNADLGYYFYKMRGVSPWNLAYQKEDNLSLSDTLLTVTGLQPFSEYVVMVYVTNSEGEFDENVYMKLQGRTLAAAPLAPRELKLLPSSHQGALHIHWKAPYPPTGEVEKYRIRWKITTDSEWLEYQDVPPSAALCHEEEVDLICHTLTELTQDNYTIQVQAFNTGVQQGSPWSAPAAYVTYETEEDDSEAAAAQDHALTVFAVLAVFSASLLAAFLFYRCYTKRQRRRKGFDRVLSTDEYRKPIIRTGSQPSASMIATATAPQLRRPPSGSSDRHNSNSDRLSAEAANGRRSCMDPLPPLPAEENIYSDLEPKKAASEEYLAPNPTRRPQEEEEEEDYLTPKPMGVVASRESLDEEGYLRPNFNRFQRLDTTSPDRATPPPIPAVSYLSGS